MNNQQLFEYGCLLAAIARTKDGVDLEAASEQFQKFGVPFKLESTADGKGFIFCAKGKMSFGQTSS